MRLLNRLNQYQRLWQPSQGATQHITVGELAERCFCSERHVRTLLRQLEAAGWVRWQASPGRGKRGQLEFLTSPQVVRAGMLEGVLNKGLQHSALELAQLAPDQLRQALQPFLGGQWQNNVPTLRIPYYRPLDKITPGFMAGRAEQQLASQVFSGLTRFSDASPAPQPDMAHHWEISQDGLSWTFYLRPTLFWHNGSNIDSHQLARRLRQLMQMPWVSALLASIADIDCPHPLCLRLQLYQPDYWLAYRLASYGCRLAHPDDDQVGCGPFRLSKFTPDLVRLENHDRYHLPHPLINAVEYWITPQLFDRTLGTSCRHPVQIAIGQPEDLVHLQPVSTSISLGFCYLAIRQSRALSPAQARWLMHIIHHSDLLETVAKDDDLIQPSQSMLPGWPIPPMPPEAIQPLPAKLTLAYHLPVELHTMARTLKQALKEYGCELTLQFYDRKNWAGCDHLAEADIVMGDRLIGESAEYTLEQWLRSDSLWPQLLSAPQFSHLQTTLDTVQRYPDSLSRHSALQAVFERLMAQGVVTPLFNYHYQISAPPNVNGLRLNARGWFDFTRVWLPPPM